MSGEDGEPVVLVDARNVVRSRWPNLEPDRFHHLVARWASAERVRAVAVWDGRAPETADGERVTVVGTGQESADDWIVREAERLARTGARVRLVSSDRELRERVPFAESAIGGGAFVARLAGLA